MPSETLAEMQVQARGYRPCASPEFYASYRTRKNILKHKSRVNTMSCLPSVLVRGQKVNITPKAINSIYWAKPIRPNSKFKRKVEDKENQFKWVAEIIANDQPQWATSK
ncbi:hypothetical protein HAX54_027372 [Datura stramonium]|uniref:Uncharacterized protein n=1 Tax=Datura stramonium TaxID=4076 RepID=A0ABS8V5H6_DATST|nr:hypothetical protein [Datura stramonium]